MWILFTSNLPTHRSKKAYPDKYLVELPITVAVKECSREKLCQELGLQSLYQKR